MEYWEIRTAALQYSTTPSLQCSNAPPLHAHDHRPHRAGPAAGRGLRGERPLFVSEPGRPRLGPAPAGPRPARPRRLRRRVLEREVAGDQLAAGGPVPPGL